MIIMIIASATTLVMVPYSIFIFLFFNMYLDVPKRWIVKKKNTHEWDISDEYDVVETPPFFHISTITVK